MVGAQIATRLYPGVRAAPGDGRSVCRAWRRHAAARPWSGSRPACGWSALIMFALGSGDLPRLRRRRRPRRSRRSARRRPAGRRRCSTPRDRSGSALGVALLTTVISAVGVTHVVDGHVPRRTSRRSTGRSRRLRSIALIAAWLRAHDQRCGRRADDDEAPAEGGRRAARRSRARPRRRADLRRVEVPAGRAGSGSVTERALSAERIVIRARSARRRRSPGSRAE